MKLSAQLTFWIALAMSAACTAYAIYGFAALGEAGLAAQEAADARGFAWFWLFLGAVMAAIAALSWMMAKGRLGELE